MLRFIIVFIVALVIITLTWANMIAVSLPPGARADRIVVEKSNRTLALYQNGKLLKSYQIALGRNPIGSKQQEGDKKTPEGLYTIDRHNERSSFHRSLHVSYPESRDVSAAAARAVAPGRDIMVHGLRNGIGLIGKLHRLVDWTAGCIAVTNGEIDEIYSAVPDGTPIEIHP